MENDNGAVILLVVLIVFAFLLIVFKLAQFFSNFSSEKRYLLSEMRRAPDYNEYRYWRRELRCHYLCLIPFVTERNVMRLYRRLFRRAKHAEKEKRSDGIWHILAPSVVGICICAVCLCGASWAWFAASTSAGTTAIKTPEKYELTVSSVNGKTAKPNGDNRYILSNGTFKVELSAIGTPGATGYCKVEIGNDVKYTDQITIGAEGTASFNFTLNADKGTVILTPKWGSCTMRDGSNAIAYSGEFTVTDTLSGAAVASNNTAATPKSTTSATPSGISANSETPAKEAATPKTTAPPAAQTETVKTEETTAAVTESAVTSPSKDSAHLTNKQQTESSNTQEQNEGFAVSEDAGLPSKSDTATQ